MEVSAPLEVVREFHASTNALVTLTPPPMSVEILRGGRVSEGMVAEFTLRLWPVCIEWHSLHENVNNYGFTDVQMQGPLRLWRHTHRFELLAEDRTAVHDEVEYEHPAGVDGIKTRLLFGRPQLAALFAYRAFQTKRICAATHRSQVNAMRLRRQSTVSFRDAYPGE